MPEGIEVEFYRRAAEAATGRVIAKVHAPDAWFCKGVTPAAMRRALTGVRVTGTRRRGKLLILDTDGPSAIGFHFGMTGRIVVDGRAPIAELEYGSSRDLAAWDRFGLTFADGGRLRLNDLRRLGGVELDPDEGRLGPDLYTITRGELVAAVGVGVVAVKARLLDQARVAGVGNLLADETMWRAGIDPTRQAASLSSQEFTTLHRTLRTVVSQLTARGGSHCGDLHAARRRDGVCPRDGTTLLRRQVGGRTTFSCPEHQR
jgi:formamidopyrimidine-DNA glycosylase